MRRASHARWQWAVKDVLDRALGALLLVVLLPVLAACAAAVWLSLGRPVFFEQSRVGRDGRAFRMWKLRTLRLGAGAPADDPPGDGLAPGGCDDASRQTPVGDFLRRVAVDELPQLLNVVRGEMSLVGPRPERPVFVARFERSVEGYGKRHRVRPGITGWAQVHGLRGRTSIVRRSELDNFYVENFSLALDAKIILRTVPIVATALLRERDEPMRVALPAGGGPGLAAPPGVGVTQPLDREGSGTRPELRGFSESARR